MGSSAFSDWVSFDREGTAKYGFCRPNDGWLNPRRQTYELHVDPHGVFLTFKESDSRSASPECRESYEGPVHRLLRTEVNLRISGYRETVRSLIIGPARVLPFPKSKRHSSDAHFEVLICPVIS
jgi:hypothetical protein